MLYYTLNVLCHQKLVPLRVVKALDKHMRVTDLRELVVFTEKQLLGTPKIGVHSVELLKRLMKERGLSLKVD